MLVGDGENKMHAKVTLKHPVEECTGVPRGPTCTEEMLKSTMHRFRNPVETLLAEKHLKDFITLEN